jgi:hypothetical protein
MQNDGINSEEDVQLEPAPDTTPSGDDPMQPEFNLFEERRRFRGPHREGTAFIGLLTQYSTFVGTWIVWAVAAFGHRTVVHESAERLLSPWIWLLGGVPVILYLPATGKQVAELARRVRSLRWGE